MFREPVGWTLSRMTPACSVSFATVQLPKCSSRVTSTRCCFVQYSRISRSFACTDPLAPHTQHHGPSSAASRPHERSIIWSRKRRTPTSYAASGSRLRLIDHGMAVAQGGFDLFGRKFRIPAQHLFHGARLGELIQNHRDRNPGASNDRLPIADAGIDSNLVIHCLTPDGILKYTSIVLDPWVGGKPGWHIGCAESSETQKSRPKRSRKDEKRRSPPGGSGPFLVFFRVSLTSFGSCGLVAAEGRAGVPSAPG